MTKKILALLVVLMVVAGFWLFESDIPAPEVDKKYTNAASAFLSLKDGARIHYRDQGHSGGPAVVLIHGSNASLHTWESWVERLGDTYRLVTLDLPGHGLTGRTPADEYSSQAFIAATKAVVEHLGLDQFVLGGNSMGGGVTWRYALAYPDDVMAMILVDASAPNAWLDNQQTAKPDESRGGGTPLAFSLLQKPWFQELARYIDPYFLVVQGLKASHYDAELVDDALIARYYDLSMREGTREATIRRFSGRRGASTDRPEDLSRLTQPTLILWGEYDGLIPVDVALQFERTLPNAKAIVYNNVGHIPMEEVPDQSAHDVRAFLSGIDKIIN